MILTCPRCAARYVVGEDQVRPQGRKVKCTACGEVWRIESQLPDPPEPFIHAPPEPEEPEVPFFETRPTAKVAKRRGRPILWASIATAVLAIAAALFWAGVMQGVIATP